MTPTRYQQVGKLYRAALEMNPDERAAFLDRACQGDDALREEVASLLGYGAQKDELLDQPALAVAAQALAEDVTTRAFGQTISHYRLLALLGRGGMGEVYLGEDTRLRRKVALKLLPASFTLDAGRVRRFKREARAASALNHPNIVTIHEVGESDGVHFLVTEHVEGETLHRRMTEQKIELNEALGITQQVAAALSAAHAAGITHRDIKPDNVMLRRDGLVKVLDFGLAKLSESQKSEVGTRNNAENNVSEVHDSSFRDHTSTMPGVVMGTPRYMSPEQASGESVDTRTDLFSLGVMLYEMAAGRPPFAGTTTGQIIAAILRDTPLPLREVQPDAPAELERILDRALRKSRDERYQTADEFAADLKALQQQEAHSAGAVAAPRTQVMTPTRELAAARTTMQLPAMMATRRRLWAAALLVCVAGASWWAWRGYKIRQARAALPRLEQLAQEERFFEAYDLAQSVRSWLPNDATLTRLMPMIGDTLSVNSQPAGAQIYLQRFTANEPPARQLIGVTPLKDYPLARGGYVLTLEKDGYERFERTVTGLNLHIQGLTTPSRPLKVEARLRETAQAHARMVFVPGGEYRLASYDRPTDRGVKLDDYFMDKYEVTNREYKEFIAAGGYLKREFWRHAILKDGRAVTWEEAMREFKDRTGLPGPRSWTNQDFPVGQAEHPVTDISWYEAAAYATFRGKELPTVYQWEKAARYVLERGQAGYYLMPWGPYTGTSAARANFNSTVTLPVDSLPFGQSPYGCHHMAGNVAEWCRNASADDAGSFAVTGGSYADPPYVFGRYGPYPGTFTASKLGFRCVLAAAAQSDQGAQALFAKMDIPNYQPVSEATFRSWQNIHQYDQSPLDSQVIEAAETADWRREKITFNSGGTRVTAYLYLPKNYPPPWQLLQMLPGDNVYQGWTSVTQVVEGAMGAYIKGGRAVLAVVLPGFQERRPPEFTVPPSNSAEYRDFVIQQAVDGRRALDYALSRPDLDASRVACYIISSGPGRKLLLSAVEPRYRTVVMVGGGFYRSNALVLPEISPVNLAPRVRPPKLVVVGRYDENMTIKTDAEPFLQLLREPKRILWFEGGHVPPPEIGVPPIREWLDKTLGPVKQ